MNLETSIYAADNRYHFSDRYDEHGTLNDLACEYADKFQSEYLEHINGETADHDDANGLAHDYARETVLDGMCWWSVRFFAVTYPDQILNRKPFDTLGAETPDQLIRRNIEEVVIAAASVLIEEMRERGDLDRDE
ncbi:hypothetical protein [Vibrio phage 33Fb.4]|uniref:Uncharacterized protein n=1 Tax=Vibrio phage vB_VpaS_HCMJ TaxID=2601627 RepID=A0A5C2ID38_9CAUD|nr:hypothetical protein HCMJ_95 [Vibrio phage vB_VpaS_HCMJ]UYE96208.1 hypothetical protein [Vibrio phage 31Fb.4]UYE96296.1 hypothetical protein [Vibrio phage 33Fb.4]